MAAAIAGCAPAITESHVAEAQQHDPRDPYEGWNRGVQSFNDSLDDHVMKPIANGYQWIMPGFADKGVTNFFSNMNDITVTLNDLLQAKFLQGGMDAGRFLVNTTVGVAGLVDVASMIDLPKHEEDFDQTLGTWGVPTGPYIVLPLLGPNSPRGFGGLIGDTVANPSTYVGAGIGSALYALRLGDSRADLLSATKIVDEAALDRYEFIRNAYFQQRNYLVHDGNPPRQAGFEDELDKEMEESLSESEKKKP
ncbi:MlaA family lipoprotein [Methylogaea oryzae]|uniref:Phospholipid-binding lipoprotein MlaA n=1 Tax=Methylogaea oryzae TaxID=1295382 RepID=A0A8D4VP45_9GAMM|nr:VacJ family lipoprotein [Methylogaea oryzae]BBL71798.1 hypothetical protein MoryE10_24040 [Methylogaea oryzae]